MIMLLIIAIIPKADAIETATVNSLNGDIAFCYITESYYINIALYNKNGEKIFSKIVGSSSGSHTTMMFENDYLIVLNWRNNKIYCLDRNGNLKSDTEISVDTMENIELFDGWKSTFGNKEYVYEDYKYVYKVPTVFKDRAKLSIIHDENETIIYETN